MKRFVPLSLSLVALATLAACGGVRTTTATVTPAPVAVAIVPAAATLVVQSTVALRPGFGRVDSITPVVYPDGTSAGMVRLGLRMDDGSAQVLDTRGPALRQGDRVEITGNSQIRYPLASR